MDQPPYVAASLRPSWPEGYELYLPEPAYFRDTPGFPREHAARVIARCIAQWASQYAAFSLRGERVRQGQLPNEPSARMALIDELFDWLTAWLVNAGHPVSAIGLRLYREGEHPEILLDQEHGLPASSLVLEATQFAVLQDTLANEGLPRDLYFPEREQRVAVEPVEVDGRVIRSYVAYSPIEWTRRSASDVALLPVPNEAERRTALRESCRSFANALSWRLRELNDPGNDRDSNDSEEELRMINALLPDVIQLHQWLLRRIIVDSDEITTPR